MNIQQRCAPRTHFPTRSFIITQWLARVGMVGAWLWVVWEALGGGR